MTQPADRETNETNETTGSSEAPETTSGGGRARTRSRRGRGRGAGREEASEPTGDDATASSRDDGGEDEAGDSSGGSSGDDAARSGARKRRRRGRRGRGRGRGGGTSAETASDQASSDQASDQDSSEQDRARRERSDPDVGGDEGRTAQASTGTRSAGGSSSGGGGRQRQSGQKQRQPDSKDAKQRSGNGGGSSSKGGKQKGAGDAPAQDGDDRDKEVRAAMAKGGTRAAAKRGGQGRSGSRRQQRPGGVPEEVRRAILEGPPRTMLVTSLQDRTQIAVLEDRTVVEHYVTRTDDVTLVGNIYMARVQNVLPGMEAAFLDIGKGRNGVLYAGEVLYDELDLEEGADERIENALKPGQQVLVQVTKDPMGSKGPRLTMHLSLAGRFMVLAPNSDLFGISRKLTDKERDRLRKLVKSTKPDHHGVIVRTAAEGATEEQITADVQRLLAKWDRVEERAKDAKALTPVYEEPPLVVKVIRDNFGPEFERCIVDSEDLYQQVRDYLEEVAPELLDKVELYGAPTSDARARAAGAPASAAAEAAEAAAAAKASEATTAAPRADQPSGEDQPSGDGQQEAGHDATSVTPDPTQGEQEAQADSGSSTSTGQGEEPPVDLEAAAERRKKLPRLFDAYDVTEQLRKAINKKVWLPSGGYLIIETTEAMKVIDVNTGKFTGGADTNLEEIVLKTNLEAADEIVRQLRLRDIGGIIIIDFIDMLLKANQEQVVRRLKRELLRDRTKTRVSDVSQLGLVQMTRKNVSQGLLESFSTPCEECGGRGVVTEID